MGRWCSPPGGGKEEKKTANSVSRLARSGQSFAPLGQAQRGRKGVQPFSEFHHFFSANSSPNPAYRYDQPFAGLPAGPAKKTCYPPLLLWVLKVRTTTFGAMGRIRQPKWSRTMQRLLLSFAAVFLGCLAIPADSSAQGARDYFHRGDVWYNAGSYDRAIAEYNRAITLDPNYAAAYVNRGHAWAQKGEHDKAVADYTRALAINPDYTDAYYGRGNARYGKGEYAKAVADFNQALAIDPNHADACSSLAWLYATCPDVRYRDGRKAFENASRAYQLSGGRDWGCIDAIAAAYAANGDFEKARRWQAKAVELASDEKSRQGCRSRLGLYERRPVAGDRPAMVNPWESGSIQAQRGTTPAPGTNNPAQVAFSLSGVNYRFTLPEGFCTVSGKDSDVAAAVASWDTQNMTHFTIISREEAGCDGGFARWAMLKTPRASIGMSIPTRRQFVDGLKNSIRRSEFAEMLDDAKKLVGKTYKDVFGDDAKIGIQSMYQTNRTPAVK